MNQTYRGIITLIRSGLTGESLNLPEKFDLETAYNEILRHKVFPIVYLGAINCGVSKQLPVMKKMFTDYCRAILLNEKQLEAFSLLCMALDKNQLDYLPVKGCNLKKMYPKPEMRIMGDADILIRLEQYDKVAKAMEHLGYTWNNESEYDYVWDSPALHVELHKYLFGESEQDFFWYFQNPWDKAEKINGNRYLLNPEDDYIYIFTHLAKHFRNGGIGCRQIIDLWVLEKNYNNLDWTYINQELRKLHLAEFNLFVRKLLLAWFDDGVWDNRTVHMTDYIFASGSWGTFESHIISDGAKKAEKVSSVNGGIVYRVFRMLFPQKSVMSRKYPILERFSLLLPFMWVYRWVTALLFRRRNIQIQKRQLKIVTAENISSFQEFLEYVGLSFNF